MIIDKSAEMKNRGVIFETIDYPSLKTDTVVKSNIYSLCIIEQKGKEVSRTNDTYGGHGTNLPLQRPEFHLKKSLFGGFKKVTLNFINVKRYTTHTKKSAKSAGSYVYNFEGDISYKIKKVNLTEWRTWAKKTKFLKQGNVWLTAGGWENLIVNLFFQKGLEAICSQKSNMSGFNVLITQDELNAIAGFIENQCKRFGFTIECSITHNCKK